MPVTIHKKHDKAHDFLKGHPVGVLATVDPDGNPHAAAIYFTIDGSSTISFLTKAGTKKADNLKRNGRAVLVVYDAMLQTTVQVTGEAVAVADPAEVNEVFAGILTASIAVSNTSVPPISKLQAGDYVAYRLRPKQVRIAVFSKPEFGHYEDLFKTSMPDGSD